MESLISEVKTLRGQLSNSQNSVNTGLTHTGTAHNVAKPGKSLIKVISGAASSTGTSTGTRTDSLSSQVSSRSGNGLSNDQLFKLLLQEKLGGESAPKRGETMELDDILRQKLLRRLRI